MFLGLDVGKDGHHAVGLAPDGKRLHDAALPNTEAKVQTLFDTLARHGSMLVVVDQPASIGALPVAVARASNRIRGLLTQIHPALEQVLGPEVQHPAVLELLSRCGGPAGLRAAGRAKLVEIVKPRAPRMGVRLVEQTLAALDEQTVVPGTTAAEKVLPRLAASLRNLLRQRDQVAAEVEGILDDHPLAGVLTSMPGIGVRTAARILLASATPPPSPPPAIWPPTPAWPRSPAAPAPPSAANTHASTSCRP